MINTCVMKEKLEALKSAVLTRAWHTSKCQARHRGQEWYLTKQEFLDLWLEDDSWVHRGRKGDDLTMCRLDMNGAWEISNVEICTRKCMLQREAQYRREKNGNTN